MDRSSAQEDFRSILPGRLIHGMSREATRRLKVSGFMSNAIGITMGDFTGIGPEVTLKALALELPTDDLRYVLIGDEAQTRELNKGLGLNLQIEAIRGNKTSARMSICNPLPDSLPAGLPAGAAVVARAAVAWLREAATRCLSKELAGMVTAPVNKEAIVRSGEQFVGQTEFLSQLA